MLGKAAHSIKSNSPEEVMWEENLAINGHMFIAGSTGTGKTHLLKKIMHQLISSSDRHLRFHLFDVHDDIIVDNESSVLFSENSEYGLNPLIVDPNPHFGGVRKKIQGFIKTINKTSRRLGDRQESVLRSLLLDLYSANGFYADNPASWVLDDGINRRFKKKYPTLNDLYNVASFKHKEMFLGTNSRTCKAIAGVNKEAIKIAKLTKGKGDGESIDETALDKLKNEAINMFTEYMTLLKTGYELDSLLKYDNKQTVKSVVDRVENLKSSGIFRSEYPPFDRSKMVWRYRLKALDLDERKMFVLFRMQEIFEQAVRRGPRDKIDQFVILDEAHIYMDDDESNIVNTYGKEIRKFGVGLICASQSFTHCTDDFLSNVSCKVILGIDELYWDKTVRSMKVDLKSLKWLRPRSSCLVHLKNTYVAGGKGTQGWSWCVF
jgi:DNA helicase HerA-like ATPase